MPEIFEHHQNKCIILRNYLTSTYIYSLSFSCKPEVDIKTSSWGHTHSANWYSQFDIIIYFQITEVSEEFVRFVKIVNTFKRYISSLCNVIAVVLNDFKNTV